MILRGLEPGDGADIRRLFLATAALGAPLELPADDLEAYARLCLEYYLTDAREHAAVLEEGGEIVGYALVAADQGDYARWARSAALRWTAHALTRPNGRAGGFHRRRLADGILAMLAAPRPPARSHTHFNVVRRRRRGLGGYLLVGHVDRTVSAVGERAWFGEANVPADKPGRLRAYQRLGGRPVHRQRNLTLSWLAGRPVDRYTLVRTLDPSDPHYVPLPHHG